MEFEQIFNDAVEYTRETFAGHWVRWLIFVILGLPFTLIRFVYDPRKIITGMEIHWELIPWGAIAFFGVLGILASFFIAGYTVRIYRGVKPAPDFTNWASLFIDGVKLDVVVIVWYLPAVIFGLLFASILLGGLFFHVGLGNPLFIDAGIIIAVLMMILFLVSAVIASLYVEMGTVRFARTGSMAEGWKYSAITEIIRRIGWGKYIVALILLGIIAFVYSFVISLPAFIPYVGWIVPVILSPLLTVFTARFFTLLYEAGEVPPAPLFGP